MVCASWGVGGDSTLTDSPEQWVAETGEPHDVCGTEDGGQLHQAGKELDRNNPE